MSDRRKSGTQNLLATVLVSIFVPSTVLVGFAQDTDSSPAGIYKTNCAACHGPDGRGSSVGKSLHVPDLHSSQVQQLSDTELNNAITQGKGNMPPFGGRLSEDQISSLVKYIRTFSNTK